MPTHTRAAGLAIVAVVAAGAPSPASARNAVYGGSTSAGAPIVINADKKAKSLRSAIVSWRATCDDGQRFPVAIPLTAVKSESGFVPGIRELATSRNGKGRFAGINVGAFDMGELAGLMSANYAGKLSAQACQRHAERDDHRRRPGREHRHHLPHGLRALVRDPRPRPRVRRLDCAGPPRGGARRRQAPEGV